MIEQGSSMTELSLHSNPGLHEYLLHRLGVLPFDTPILDLGCGSGDWLVRLADHGFHNLLGVDSESEALFEAHGRVSFVRANLNQELELSEVRFGLITAIEVFEHLSNPERLFDHAERYLSDSGLFLLTTPNIYSVRARARFLITSRMPFFEIESNTAPGHLHPLMLAPLSRAILKTRQLEIINVWTYPERGSNGTRWPLKLLERLASLMLPNDLPGDSLCVLMKRSGALTSAR